MKNNCKQIHETVVRDVFDIIDSAKDFDEVEWLKKKNNTGSIAKRASNLVLTFPAIVSTSNNIENAMMICKAIERKCTSLLQILFSSVQITNVDNLQDYINQFHTNLSLKNGLDLDEFMGIMDKLVDEGAVQVTDTDAYQMVMEDMKNISYVLPTEFNPVSLNDYKSVQNCYGESTIMLEARGKNPFDTIKQDFVKDINKEFDKQVNALSSNAGKIMTKLSGGNNKSNDPTLKDRTTFLTKQILPSDVKKANELMPTVMMVNFTTIKDGVRVMSTGVVGVKVKMYPVDSIDIVNRLSSKVKDSNGLFNLIRATTREISFFKDLAFAIDKAKLDAVYMAKDSNNAKLFRLLERRAAKNKYMSLIRKNNASPITSLILSQEDIEYLKKYNNIDMEKSHYTRTILESFNLMDIVIVDESLELAKFLYDDGDGIFETITFDGLEREASDNSYKKVINLMSKINR